MSSSVFSLPEAVHYDGDDGMGGRCELELTAGEHTAKSERDEYVLNHLASLGLAKAKAKPKG